MIFQTFELFKYFGIRQVISVIANLDYNSLLRDYSLKRGEDNRIVVLLQPWLVCLVTPAWPLAPPGPGHQCSQALTTPSSGVMIIINTFSIIADRDPVKINCTQPFSERLFCHHVLGTKGTYKLNLLSKLFPLSLCSGVRTIIKTQECFKQMCCKWIYIQSSNCITLWTCISEKRISLKMLSW